MASELSTSAAHQWNSVTPAIDLSPSRMGAACCWSPGSLAMVLFGGSGPHVGFLGDTWLWDGVQWREVPTNQSPPPRAGCALSVCNAAGDLVCFGGFGATADEQGTGFLGDSWLWDGGGWNPLEGPSGPTLRSSASGGFDEANSEVVLFGGFFRNRMVQFLDDTWTFGDGAWSQRVPSPSPANRFGSAMCFDQQLGKILLFGGANFTQLGDTWTWDGNSWSLLSPQHSPPPRQNAGMVHHPGLGGSLLFGGVGTPDAGGATLLADTWLFAGGDWTELGLLPSPPPCDGSSLVFATELGKAVLRATTISNKFDPVAHRRVAGAIESSLWTL